MGKNIDLERPEPPKNHNFLRKCESGERYVEKMPSLKIESTQEVKNEAEVCTAQKN